MTVVIGTAGHIDHGKTTLLRVLTGTDADRLPEERQRGLTIDVGYAHAAPDDGPEVDFVDVPGHDKLVGNMLVGAGEIDAALLVVAADDGPRAQTWEHLGLLDALGISAGVVAITKSDSVDAVRIEQVSAELREALRSTSLADVAIVPVSSLSGQGIAELRGELAVVRDRVTRQPIDSASPGAWLAIDRVFTIRGRGVVVTGSSRGRAITAADPLRVLPGGATLRVRGLQVHDAGVQRGPQGGRVAINLTGDGAAGLRRGQLLVSGATAEGPRQAVSSDRLLVVLRQPAAMPRRAGDVYWPPGDGDSARLHIGTDQADAVLGRNGRDAVELSDGRAIAMLRLDREVAVAVGQRFLLRQPAPAGLLGGGRVLDAAPVRGRSRRRQEPRRLLALAQAVEGADDDGVIDALLDLRGYLRVGGLTRLSADVQADVAAKLVQTVRHHHRAHADLATMPLSSLRASAAATIRASLSISEAEAKQAAGALVDAALADGTLRREGDGVHTPEFVAPTRDPEFAASMSRLHALLDTPAPPPLAQAAVQAGCPAEGVRELEQAGRIVIVVDDLAWSSAAYAGLQAEALSLARSGPLTPALLRDATGTSRKYVMALLEDLARRGILTRTAAGHVLGPRAP